MFCYKLAKKFFVGFYIIESQLVKSISMKILPVNNNCKQTNFEAREFRTYSAIGPLKCNGNDLGTVYRDFEIIWKRKFHIVGLVQDVTDKIMAVFYAKSRDDAKILEDSLRRAVNCAKTTDGNPVRFQYIRNEPNFIIEEQVS